MIDGIVLALGLSLLCSVILWGVSAYYRPQWEESKRFEGLPGGKKGWNITFGIGTALGLLATLGTYSLVPNPYIAASMSIGAWIFALVAYTDTTILKIPREPTIAAYWMGIPLMVAYGLETGAWAPMLISFGIWFIMPLIFFLPKSIGMGDVRIMMIAWTTLSWWVGIQGMYVWGLFTAVAIQFILFAAARKFKGIGVWAYRGELAAKAAGEEFKPGPKDKKRLHLPFGPALMIGLLIGAIVTIMQRDLATCSAILGNFCY